MRINYAIERQLTRKQGKAVITVQKLWTISTIPFFRFTRTDRVICTCLRSSLKVFKKHFSKFKHKRQIRKKLVRLCLHRVNRDSFEDFVIDETQSGQHKKYMIEKLSILKLHNECKWTEFGRNRTSIKSSEAIKFLYNMRMHNFYIFNSSQRHSLYFFTMVVLQLLILFCIIKLNYYKL